MADFLITVTNSVRSFGPAPSTKWGAGSPYTMTWGTSKWGEGTQDLIVSVTKYLSNSQGSDTTLYKSNSKFYSSSVSPTGEMSREVLSDGSGYSYLYPDNTTDLEGRDFTTFTSGTAQTTSYSSATAQSTTWS